MFRSFRRNRNGVRSWKVEFHGNISGDGELDYCELKSLLPF